MDWEPANRVTIILKQQNACQSQVLVKGCLSGQSLRIAFVIAGRGTIGNMLENSYQRWPPSECGMRKSMLSSKEDCLTDLGKQGMVGEQQGIVQLMSPLGFNNLQNIL
ncbi:unnamed protein product [Paramecium primaurelia]|uniref:Uncharacterized protein n=1 Tax=Paramecium primaurelia TaxID=5886 RepID=A0A8S1JWX8_PARPR|nr:unnamed protein product [Paramecium primaurelia]